MLGFVARRLLISVPVLFAASILVFIMVANSGDPLGDLHSRPNVPRAVIEARRHELNLDRPVVVRYGTWAGHFLKGDFGKSIGGRDVRTELWRRMKVTLRMVLLSVVDDGTSTYLFGNDLVYGRNTATWLARVPSGQLGAAPYEYESDPLVRECPVEAPRGRRALDLVFFRDLAFAGLWAVRLVMINSAFAPHVRCQRTVI